MTRSFAAAILGALLLTACFDDKGPVIDPPQIQGVPPTEVVEGTMYDYAPRLLAGDSTDAEFAISGKPDWAAFDQKTGRLTGRPTATHVGETAPIVITVRSHRGEGTIGPFRIRVVRRDQAAPAPASTPAPAPTPVPAPAPAPAPAPPPPNTPPSIAGAPPTAVVAGQLYRFQPSATDADGDALSFVIMNMPAWASFNTATGVLSGTPGSAAVGTYLNISISVSDGRSSASLVPFSIQVQAAPNRAPTVSGSPAMSVQATRAYSFQPSATDPDGDRLTWSITNRPAWASFDTATGRLSGTPAANQTGTYGGITISVSDGSASAALPPFAINVTAAPNAPPTISGAPSSAATVGVAYSFTPTASDPDGNPLTFSVQNLPVWATFSTSSGAITGTPSSGHTGTFSGITITVSDGTSSASLAPFAITVTPAGSSGAGTASLSWIPPTENEDGTPLVNLAGYRIYYGTSPSALTNVVTLNGSSTTRYVIQNLGAGTWYFGIRAFTSSGTESALSALASKTI